MNITINNCAIIILAAGASTRLGRPKQLLPFNGKSLLENAVDTANEAEANPVIVVLGANAALSEKEIDEKKVHIVENKEWKEGMATSIRCGLGTLQHIAPSADGVILMVCDQPHVSSALLNELITLQKKTASPIVTSQYKDVAGPPALFHKSVFPELQALKGDAGARKIVEKYQDNLATVSFEKGNVDIDTEDDYKALINNTEQQS
ncbi:nucleotidyltransferase family protein [Terrimonas pollutisoli]|uniref:nucleotidyltransferase family protein n=1 Tax=Terrimonas pollutisoli TaxID=3034147 RepID=UPI0023ECB3CF|nr:nucleotidyltransferase family protein [Terrimonas sp. H1YJ31]